MSDASELTIFHKIVAGEIPADKVYETDEVLGFKDINPKAPTHILFITKKEKDFFASINDLTEETKDVPGKLICAAQEFAKEKGIDGYKLTFHVGSSGGQEVFYPHLHFMSQENI